ncbi:MAG: hypothetical protein AAF664_13645 [Planctomycetota bacterium]
MTVKRLNNIHARTLRNAILASVQRAPFLQRLEVNVFGWPTLRLRQLIPNSDSQRLRAD